MTCMLSLKASRETHNAGLPSGAVWLVQVRYGTTLDLAPYMLEQPSTPRLYQLCAVNVHKGSSMAGGHYVAYVHAPDSKWYCMDNDDVSPVSCLSSLEFQTASHSCNMMFLNGPFNTRRVHSAPPSLCIETLLTISG